MARRDTDQLLLGEWACLGVLYPRPTHGFAIAARMKPTGDVGRAWSMSRPLTYRALDELMSRGFARPVSEEPGIAGGNRRVLAATPAGRAALRTWLAAPVEHLRDLRSELLVKLIIAEHCRIDMSAMLDAQRAHVVRITAAIEEHTAHHPTDPVALWRSESAKAAVRFLERL